MTFGREQDLFGIGSSTVNGILTGTQLSLDGKNRASKQWSISTLTLLILPLGIMQREKINLQKVLKMVTLSKIRMETLT